MKRSTDRILTTHVGSLARPHELLDTLKERENGRPYDTELLDRQITEAVADRVRQQVDNGIDIVTDGEMSKVSFLGYVKDRLGGFEPDLDDMRMAPSWQKEVDDFPEYYADYFKKYSATITPLRRIICKGPISYIGQELLQTDIANLRAAVAGYDVADVFMPSTGPSGFGRNEYYGTHEEYLAAVAEAMREEYLAIVAAGFVLQVDDPFLIDMLSDPTMDEGEREKAAWVHVEALNHALRGIPTEQIRHHTCYGLNHGPRMNDIPLIKAVPFMLAINAGANSFEVANPRHYHEWRIWEDIDAARGPHPDARPARPRHELRRASRADRRLPRQVRRHRRPRERHRQRRLRLLVTGELCPRGPPDGGLAEVPRPRRRRRPRHHPALALKLTTDGCSGDRSVP